MPNVIALKISEETHRALRQRAALNARSTEAEIREVLDATVRPEKRLKIGSELAALGKRFGGLDIDTGKKANAPDE